MQRQRVSNYLVFERHVTQHILEDQTYVDCPQQKFEECEMGSELFSSPESSFSISTDNEDFSAEFTEDGSYITAKSDNFSLLDEIKILTESYSTEDANFVSRKDEENDGFYRTTIGRETLFIEENENMKYEENEEAGHGAEGNDSNANTSEQSLILQGIRMDEWNFILVPDKWNFWEPVGAIIEEPFTIPTTEVPNSPSLPPSFGAFEVDKILQAHAEKRATIWDCCGFCSWFHAHKD